MEREGIVDLAPDTALGEPSAQLLPARNADDVLMKDMMRARVDPGQYQPTVGIRAGLDDSGSGEELVIPCGQDAAAIVPLVHVAQFYQQNRSLEGVQPAVPTNLFVMVTDLHAVCPEAANTPCDCGAGCGNHAGLSRRAEIFGGVKAKCRCCSKSACGNATPLRSKGLRRILDQQTVAGGCRGSQGGPVGALAVEMYRQKGAGSGMLLQDFRRGLWVEVVSAW